MIDFQCGSCRSKLQIDDAQAGHKIQCPMCKSLQDVPGSDVPHMGIHCTACGNDMSVDATQAGTMQRCPGCGAMVLVPSMGKEGGGEGCLGVVLLFLMILTTGATLLIRG
jgi:DNA-directed RNA polymerase subunit RPC12/RpoP